VFRSSALFLSVLFWGQLVTSFGFANSPYRENPADDEIEVLKQEVGALQLEVERERIELRNHALLPEIEHLALRIEEITDELDLLREKQKTAKISGYRETLGARIVSLTTELGRAQHHYRIFSEALEQAEKEIAEKELILLNKRRVLLFFGSPENIRLQKIVEQSEALFQKARKAATVSYQSLKTGKVITSINLNLVFMEIAKLSENAERLLLELRAARLLAAGDNERLTELLGPEEIKYLNKPIELLQESLVINFLVALRLSADETHFKKRHLSVIEKRRAAGALGWLAHATSGAALLAQVSTTLAVAYALATSGAKAVLGLLKIEGASIKEGSLFDRVQSAIFSPLTAPVSNKLLAIPTESSVSEQVLLDHYFGPGLRSALATNIHRDGGQQTSDLVDALLTEAGFQNQMWKGFNPPVQFDSRGESQGADCRNILDATRQTVANVLRIMNEGKTTLQKK